MQTSIPKSLKVLTPKLAEELCAFNRVCRTLQKMDIRLHRIDPTNNSLIISPEDGHHLMTLRLLEGFQRHGTAGSTHYTARFQNVEVTWSEPISYRDYKSPKNPTDLTLF